jgi:hypothetical protein
MATKKNTKKSTMKNFVVQFHSNLNDPDIIHDPPKFYSESGQGWVDDIGSATRYSASGADKIMLELLKEHKVASELVDLNVKPDNIFSINTAFLNNWNIPQIITKVPQYHGDTYYLLPSAEDIEEQDLVDMFRDDVFMILWDSDRSVVPESNWEFLKALGCVE